jgi:antirestriction protein ArdC
MSVYEEVTHSVLADLENNTPPWIKNWQPHLPHNLVSKREYRGVNVFLLWSRGFTSPSWLTSRQARALGGHIKKGSKTTRLVRAAHGRAHGEALGDEDEYRSLTWSPVFNVEQTEGIPSPQGEDKQPRDAMDAAEAFLSALGATIIFGMPGAEYDSPADTIHLPYPEELGSMASFYSTSLHEHMHWTGHDSRLNRHSIAHYGEEHAIEELVAEMGAAFLCSHLGVSPKLRNDHMAHGGGRVWLDPVLAYIALPEEDRYVFLTQHLELQLKNLEKQLEDTKQ